jgi:HK97 family phage portal protein
MSFKDFFKVKNNPTKTTQTLTNSYRGTAPTLNSKDMEGFYNEVAYLNLMIRKVAEGISMSKWKLHKTIAGKKVRVFEHPILDLINNFNPLMNTGMDGWYSIQSWLEINGNAYLMMERDDQGFPVYLWSINPNDVLELPSKTNDFNYVVKIKESINKIPLTEIIHLKNLNPQDIYGKGIGTIHAMLDVLQTTKYSSKQVVNYFYNQAVPPYIIGADVTPDQLTELKQSWDMNNKGFWNRHKPYFTNSSSIQVQKLTDSFNDMQMLQILENGAETIRQLFGIPPEIIGKVENSNRATIQGAREIFAKEVLMYRLLKIQETLNNTLVLEFGNNLTIEFESPVPSDKEFILRGMKDFKEQFKFNEIRELLGFEPDYKKEDEYMEASDDIILEKDNMPINRADNPKSDEDIRRENEVK